MVAFTYGRNATFNIIPQGYLFNYTGDSLAIPQIRPEVNVNGKVGIGYDLQYPYHADAPTLSVNGNVGVGRIDSQPYSADSPLLRVDGNVEINTIPDQTFLSTVPLLTVNGAAPETRTHSLLEVREGLLAQIEEGSVNTTDGKYVTIGVTPKHPDGHEAFNPDSCYGVRVNWDTDFAMMQLIDFGKGTTNRKDMVLIWGDNRNDKLRIRYAGWLNRAETRYGVREVVQITSGGDMWVRGRISSSSDLRLKENVEVLHDALDKVMSLRGVSYTWKRPELDNDMNDADDPGLEIGLVAQEVEKVIPEIISTDEDGYKAIDYTRITPFLLEALKEQQSIIQAQGERLDRLERSLLSVGTRQSS